MFPGSVPQSRPPPFCHSIEYLQQAGAEYGLLHLWVTAPAGVSAAFRYTFSRPTLTCRRTSHCKPESNHGYQYLSLYNGSKESG